MTILVRQLVYQLCISSKQFHSLSYYLIDKAEKIMQQKH